MSKLEKLAFPPLFALTGIAYVMSRAMNNEAFTFHWMAQEDGCLEWLTAIALLSGAMVCWWRCWTLRHSHPSVFRYCTAIYGGVLLFGMGEEISWGQRVFGIETPEFLAEVNAQKETNLHNLVVKGTSINKLIFGKILAVGLFCYLIPMPIFFQRSPSVRRFFNRLAVPIPRVQHSLAILAVVILVETSRATKRGEITEFAITSLVLLMLLNPLNLTTFRRPETIVEQKKTLETPFRAAA